MTDSEIVRGTLACVCVGLQGFNLVIIIIACVFKRKIFEHYTTFAFAMLCCLLFNLFLVLSYKFLAGTPWGVMDFICLIINCVMICLFTLAVCASDIIMLEDN